ncbi:TIR and AAA domain-containing protein [uncultured Thiodictyon sp.]|jgi:hypothetical protein|uniref:TIR and AAA domain-containing protein n=1 Tax=uncultured Thiodictyon sp. TaxID=1846217 RepID=UPI0025EB8DE8|nr:TIR and AAA domain-containing protein [uncultured Thiodictyon sp.]
MAGTPRVFISYSHDSDHHRARVLAFSERLRRDGIPTDLDRYVNGTPPAGWPRWMLDRLDEGDRVILICTRTYYRRFRGHEEPGKGKGVDWEGAVVTQTSYNARSRTTRFIPVLFDPADEPYIPEPVRGQSFYRLDSEPGYLALYDALLEQAGVEPAPVGEPRRRPCDQAQPLRFPDPGGTAPAPRIDLSKLPAGAPDFLGRGPELAMLDAAWSGDQAGAGVHIVTLIAPGGVGKTALVKRWLDRLRADGWRGAERVFGWSFYSQGTGDDRQASDDLFLSEALAWFGVAHDPAASPWDKGRLLAQAVAARRTLLVLDGCEPLQYPPGPLAGQLRAPGLKVLLTQLAGTGQPGLTLLTSREAVADLAEYARGPETPRGPVLTHDLENLSDRDGAQLLHRVGCARAGAAAIGPDDAELCAASREVRGHALTLSLLGRYLAEAQGGDCRRRDTVDLMTADNGAGGHVARVLAAYEQWLGRAGDTVELAALRLLGLFDRPAEAGCIRALREAPPIPGLTEPLLDLTQARWNQALSRLAACGLIERPGQGAVTGAPPPPPVGWIAAAHPPAEPAPVDSARASAEPDPQDPHARLIHPTIPVGAQAGALDAHPLVREYLGRRLREAQPDAWREGHRRLYDYLKASVPERPDGMAGLQPLYQAVAHGCLAGLQQEACQEVYYARIGRGAEAYAVRKLGAFGAELGAVACFFDEPWQRVSAALTEPARAWLLNHTAIHLRALGRLTEALEPMRAGLELYLTQENWGYAARVVGNLSELDLTLGLVSDALADAGRSVEYADRSGDTFLRMAMRTTLADALHQQGERGPALGRFHEAETMQAEFQPQYPLLYSLQGYQYCDLLLAGPERATWRALLALWERLQPRREAAATGEAQSRPEAAATGPRRDLGGQGSAESVDWGDERGPAPGDAGAPLGFVPQPNLRAECDAVAKRAGQTLEWLERAAMDLLSIALDHLTLGRAALSLALLDPAGPTRPALDRAARELTAAVDGLRAAGTQHWIPAALLPRALLHTLLQSPVAARADLDEAEQIASRGGMNLLLADCRLHRARLLRDRAELARARALIEHCGYWRRREELEDAETAAPGWS